MRMERSHRARATTGEPVDPRIAELPTSRYEWKYLVPDAMVPELRRFIRPFVRSDRFAATRRDLRYPICSLYLDTADLQLCEQTRRGEKNRFKLRIRSYSDKPGAPVYLEIKRKIDRVVRKRRVSVPRGEVGGLVRSGPAIPGPFDGIRRTVTEEFLTLAGIGSAGPVVRIGYTREPYESPAGDPVRITFDTELRYKVTLDYSLRRNGPSWSPVPLKGTILEIKYTDRYPGWISEMVRCFGLRRSSVAKYVLSMNDAVETGRYWAWMSPAAAERS